MGWLNQSFVYFLGCILFTAQVVAQDQKAEAGEDEIDQAIESLKATLNTEEAASVDDSDADKTIHGKYGENSQDSHHSNNLTQPLAEANQPVNPEYESMLKDNHLRVFVHDNDYIVELHLNVYLSSLIDIESQRLSKLNQSIQTTYQLLDTPQLLFMFHQEADCQAEQVDAFSTWFDPGFLDSVTGKDALMRLAHQEMVHFSYYFRCHKQKPTSVKVMLFDQIDLAELIVEVRQHNRVFFDRLTPENHMIPIIRNK